MTTTLTPTPSLAGTVAGLLDIDVTIPTAAPDAFTDLAGLALRNNPRRAHLIVSKVLGKHIPTDPHAILNAAHALADNVSVHLDAPVDETALVIGYCETATGLGHAVAARLGGSYLHTTRRLNPTVPVAAQFDEEHSHAVAHLLQPSNPVSLAGSGPLVLVDDELTSGKTALNTLAALHEQWPRPLYIIATLLDARTPEARAKFDEAVAASGLNVKVASVLDAYLHLPVNVLDRASIARDSLPPAAPAPTGAPAPIIWHTNAWPTTVPITARHGMTDHDTGLLHDAVNNLADYFAVTFDKSESVLVLGTEEVMYAPTVLAAALADRLPETTVHFQSTTRSPVHAADDPTYALRRTVTFTAPDDSSRMSLVHNLADPSAVPPPGTAWSDLRYDRIVVVVDAIPAECLPLADALQPYAHDGVHMFIAPAPPVTNI